MAFLSRLENGLGLRLRGISNKGFRANIPPITASFQRADNESLRGAASSSFDHCSGKPEAYRTVRRPSRNPIFRTQLSARRYESGGFSIRQISASMRSMSSFELGQYDE